MKVKRYTNFSLKMHHKAFVGWALPEPAGRAYRLQHSQGPNSDLRGNGRDKRRERQRDRRGRTQEEVTWRRRGGREGREGRHRERA